MPNIGDVSIKGIKKGKPKLEQDGFILRFYQTKKSLSDLEEYNRFIKGAETIIRKSLEYKHFKNYIMDDLGVNYCQVMPNIKSELGITVPITIEMHHGPILTLYDICSIVLDHMLDKGELMTTIRLAKMVIDEHMQGRVQVVMLSDLAHRAIDNNKLFLDVSMGLGGSLEDFLVKYIDVIQGEEYSRRAYIIEKNIEISRQFGSYYKDKLLEAMISDKF